MVHRADPQRSLPVRRGRLGPSPACHLDQAPTDALSSHINPTIHTPMNLRPHSPTRLLDRGIGSAWSCRRCLGAVGRRRDLVHPEGMRLGSSSWAGTFLGVPQRNSTSIRPQCWTSSMRSTLTRPSSYTASWWCDITTL